MKKILLALALVSTTACATFNPMSPAPLAATTADEKTLIIALQTFDTALTAVDELVRARVITPGSPKALAIAKQIEIVKQAYVAASAAQRVGNASSYFAALTQAQVALANINSFIKGV